MQPNKNVLERLNSPAATTTRRTYAYIFAATGLIFLAVWYFGGDRFITTPTIGGTNGNVPAATPVPAK